MNYASSFDVVPEWCCFKQVKQELAINDCEQFTI